MAYTSLDRAASTNREARGIKTDEMVNAEKAVAEKRRQSWQDALRAAAAGMVGKGMDAQTMAGFAVGRWLSDYLARGRNKAEERANAKQEAEDSAAEANYKNNQNTTGVNQNVAGVLSPSLALQPGLLGGAVDPSNFSKLASTENMLNTIGLGAGKYSDPLTQATNDIIAQNFTGPTAGVDASSIGRLFDKDKAVTSIFGF